VNDVWFNPKLQILMNKKTAAAQIDLAVHKILLEAVCDGANKK